MKIIRIARSFLKGLKDSFKYRTLNPFRFQMATAQSISKYSNFYLVNRIKHEAHLIDKATKNPYEEGRAQARASYLKQLINELKTRKQSHVEILRWAELILKNYSKWKKHHISLHQEGTINFNKIDPLSVPSIRFWESQMPSKQDILKCVSSAQLAPASCNRQAFLIKVLVNNNLDNVEQGALNNTMFNSVPYRVFVFINRNNYSEKYSCFIDLGMFTQNFILQAKKLGLGCCTCYGSEQLDRSQKFYRDKFQLGDEYYCGLSILVGYPKELVEKPPRIDPKLIVDFRDK